MKSWLIVSAVGNDRPGLVADLARLIYDALRPPGGLGASQWVDLRTDVTTALLRAHRPVPIQVDGSPIWKFRIGRSMSDHTDA